MSQGNKEGAAGGLIAVALVALCCGGPLLLAGLATVAPAVLAAFGSPWLVVAAAAIGASAVGIVLWRRAKDGAACDVPDRRHETPRRLAG